MMMMSSTVTYLELEELSEFLLKADHNNCAHLININLQGSTSFRSSRDNAPVPLLTIHPFAYTTPTISKLLPLYDNYVAEVGGKEFVTREETYEEGAFLDALLSTEVMKITEKFLIEKGFISNRLQTSNGFRNNPFAFREALHEIWFGLYSRENGTLGSSGFEHVFLGEIKEGKVQGFHNWVFFGKEEEKNAVNYKGQIGSYLSLGNKGMVLKHKFDWNSTEKPMTTMFIGTSPEFEMALYTICFYTRPGAKCRLKLNGNEVTVQTHFSTRKGKRYIGSAYVDI